MRVCLETNIPENTDYCWNCKHYDFELRDVFYCELFREKLSAVSAKKLKSIKKDKKRSEIFKAKIEEPDFEDKKIEIEFTFQRCKIAAYLTSKCNDCKRRDK